MSRSWLPVRQVAQEMGFCEDTVRIMCARGDFPNAVKSTNSPKAHWRIPEDDIKNFGAKRAETRTFSLDHKRRKELMAQRRQAA